MKFLFLPQSCVPFHGRTLEERPLGGTETGVIRLAEALEDLGEQVYILSEFQNPPLSKPLYLPLRSLYDLGAVDVLIAVRAWLPLFVELPAQRRLFWTGDAYDQPQTVGIGDKRIVNKADALLAVSSWHADTMATASGFPREKCYVLGNGIKLSLFAGTEQRDRKRLIYSSTPYRGLQLLPAIFTELRRRHPEATLHVFSGYGVYAGPQGYNKKAEADFQLLRQSLEKLPGCTVHGNIKQGELAREFMKSAILCYPNTFLESSCITAMEAQAAGCPIVSTAHGALPETVGDAGILISGDPNSAAYQEKFVDAVDRLFCDDALFAELSQKALTRAPSFSWHEVAKRFLSWLKANES